MKYTAISNKNVIQLVFCTLFSNVNFINFDVAYKRMSQNYTLGLTSYRNNGGIIYMRGKGLIQV